jgi:hypothetical protein
MRNPILYVLDSCFHRNDNIAWQLDLSGMSMVILM